MWADFAIATLCTALGVKVGWWLRGLIARDFTADAGATPIPPSQQPPTSTPQDYIVDLIDVRGVRVGSARVKRRNHSIMAGGVRWDHCDTTASGRWIYQTAAPIDKSQLRRLGAI